MNEALVLKNNLKEVRTQKGMSQADLAKLVGVSRNTISSIETGQFSPTAKLALILCACACDTARSDLAVGADEALQKLYILIVDVGDVVLCEVADLSAAGSLLSECHLISPLSLEREIVAGNIQG